jgi:hypothetical protein
VVGQRRPAARALVLEALFPQEELARAARQAVVGRPFQGAAEVRVDEEEASRAAEALLEDPCQSVVPRKAVEAFPHRAAPQAQAGQLGRARQAGGLPASKQSRRHGTVSRVSTLSTFPRITPELRGYRS